MKYLAELFPMQAELDEMINDRRGLSNHDIIQEKMMALLVEVGEMANETRCFKYWSKKGPSAKGVIAEEFADCLHFILSIGNYIDFIDSVNISDIDIEIDMEEDLTKLFINFFHAVVNFRNRMTVDNYLEILRIFEGIRCKLGFSKDDVVEAYHRKHEINFKRQASGY